MVEEKVFSPDNLEEFEQARNDVTYRFCKFENLMLGDMVGRNFQNCVFVGCSFKENAVDKNGKDVVRPANMARSVMTGCLVRGCDLSGVKGNDFGFYNTDFVDCNLSKASFLGASFEKGEMVGCKVDRMVVDGNITGVKFGNLTGKAVVTGCDFIADEQSYEFNNSINFYKSLVRSEVNKHVLHFNDFTVERSVRDDRGVTVMRRFFHTDSYKAFLRQSERSYRNKVYKVVRSAGPQMGLETKEQKKKYIEQETKKYVAMVAKDIQESFDFMRKYNSSSKRDVYVNNKAAEMYQARETGDLSAKREAADMSYRSAAIEALTGKVTKRTLESKSWLEAEEAVLKYREKDEAQREADSMMYVRAAYEKTAEKRGIANRDWKHIREQQAAESREREDMTHERDVTDLRESKKEYTDKVQEARQDVIDAARKLRSFNEKTGKRVTITGYNEDGSPIVKTEEYKKEVKPVLEKPFEYRMVLKKDAGSNYFRRMLLDAASGSTDSLDSKADEFMKKLCKGQLRYRKGPDGMPMRDSDGKVVTVLTEARMPGFERYGNCGSSGVSVDKSNGNVTLVVGRFRKGQEQFDAVARYEPAGAGKISLVLSGSLKEESRGNLDKFIRDEDMFRGMNTSIVNIQAPSQLKVRQNALNEAKGTLREAHNDYKEYKKSDDFQRKEAAEMNNQLFAVSSGVLDYSGNAGQFNDQQAGSSYGYKKGRSGGVSSGASSNAISYRFYIPSDCKNDVTELYPLLDGIEERDLGVLAKRASSLDKVMEGLGFEKSSGVSVIERNGETEGRLGRYVRDGASVTVRAMTENKAGTGYYEVLASGMSVNDKALDSLVMHSDAFSGLDVYNGSASLKSSVNLGRNDGSLGLEGHTPQEEKKVVTAGKDVSEDSGKDSAAVVDFSDVGKNKGKGVSIT